jgi:aspartyl protease family protein
MREAPRHLKTSGFSGHIERFFNAPGHDRPMLKAVLLLAGLMFAVAAIAPDMLTRATQTVASGKTEEPVLANIQPDHGGLVRLNADRSGHYQTEAEINNRMVPVLVDTGATLIALRYEDARSMGLVTSADKFDVRVRTANGEGRAKRVTLRSVTVGTITVRDVEALVTEQGALATNLLGMSFLKRLARFEVQRGQLVLER